jgi:hypothetical protein
MKYTAIRLGAIGTTVATAGILAASSVASAMPMNSNNGNASGDPCQNMQQSGNTITSIMDGRYGSSSHHNSRWRVGHAWNFLNPLKFMGSGQNNMAVNSNTMGEIATYLNSVKTNWNSDNSNASWTPSGSNWQTSWSNWNPALWEQQGATYANWNARLTAYLNTTYPNFSTQLSALSL